MSKNQQILIYAETITNRLDYIIDTLFNDLASITTDQAVFAAFDGPKINYSVQAIDHATIHIYPHGLLAETIIAPQKPVLFKFESKYGFFATPGTFPFDIFAAAFYLITRYEEYLPHQTDHLGRYEPTQSLAYQGNFLKVPLVHLWMYTLSRGLNIDIPKKPLSIQPTYDIDIAYSYLHHPILKNTLGYFKDLMHLKLDKITERLEVLGGIQADPYDVYNWLLLLHDSLKVKPLYFFLATTKKNQLHKQVQLHSKGFQALVKQHAAFYTVGLHPSAAKTDSVAVWQKEKQTLESIVEAPITISRQHYLYLRFPDTYATLIEMGIQADYSMGYPQINGFRASYMHPFKWFNLSTNTVTNLTVHPFCYMDATAIFHEKLTAYDAVFQLDLFYEWFLMYGGRLIAIFHNNFLTTQPDYEPWRNTFADFLINRCTRERY